MPAPLSDALDELRPLLLDPSSLVRAVAAGRRRNARPAWRRVELRPVDLDDERRLQVVRYDDRQAVTANLPYDAVAAEAVDDLLGQPFGNWHIETTGATVQLRVTKKGTAQVHRQEVARLAAVGAHDRAPRHLLDPGDPVFAVVGGGADKRRQVDAFVRALQPALGAVAGIEPLRVVDLGCGNAYLTFGAYRYLTGSRGLTVELTGVDLRPESRARNTELAAQLGWSERVQFLAGSIAAAPVAGADVVLALHACDTATDEALARAVRWQARLILASPCCHHDLQVQLGPAPAPYGVLTRHAILRERFADTATDALRAALLRLLGYRVDVIEFVERANTPRDVLIRAVRTGAAPDPVVAGDYARFVCDWGVRPALQRLLSDELAGVLG